MDELRDFLFNPSGSKVIKLRGPSTGGVRLTKDDDINIISKRLPSKSLEVPLTTDYAIEVKEKETKLYVMKELEREANKTLEGGSFQSIPGGMESMEQLTLNYTSEHNLTEKLTEEAMMAVYNKYSFQKKEKTYNLGINEYKYQILSAVNSFAVVIVEGPTGCGKTTQVPQWILDDCYQHRKPCKIIVTQPRRIAAISIAKRVAHERGWDVGGLVGYQVGLENKTSSDTRITYVTTGILLQKLVSSKTLNEYTHIILDEVHERGQEMDFLLIVIRRLLYTVSPFVKIILMSATFNIHVFASYFQLPTHVGLKAPKCVEVAKKRSMFNVKVFYLTDLQKFGTMLQQVKPNEEEPSIVPEMHHLVIKLIDAFEQIDEDEEGYENYAEANLPSVLIFLPGINEIEELYNCLMDIGLRKKLVNTNCAKYNWWVLPLHSTITADEQVRVFQRAPPGHRKIILATNIAESSITVPDIKYVIDYCLMKTLVADPDTNFTSLQMTWASRTNCQQRAGRAGRVRDGRVYRLVSEKYYAQLPEECPPEILRSPLERLVLLAKLLDMGTPSEVLALAMNPPNISNIHRTLLVLKEIGALKKLTNKEWNPLDGEITYLGRVMAKLPLDVRVSKLIILGHIFGCLEESIIMAAAMSVKNVFSSPFRERLNAYNSKLTWADGSTSDCIAFLNVYRVWSHFRQQNQFKQTSDQIHWARKFYVQVRALRELEDMVKELKMRLSREGIETAKGKSPWTRSEVTLVLKVIIAGAFYPQYFIQMSQDGNRERDAVRTLGGLNPRNTVYLKDFPANQPGEIYASTIRNAVCHQIGDEPRVIFDNNSRKVFLTFTGNVQDQSGTKRDDKGDPTIPGQVVLPVYKAVKTRQLQMFIRVPLLPEEKAKEMASALEMNQIPIERMVPRLPEIDDTYFPLRLSHVVNVGRFWIQYDDESTTSELRRIDAALNSGNLLAVTGDVSVGDLLAAPYIDRNVTTVHRVRVLRMLPKEMVQILYIDYGSHGTLNVCSLRELPPGLCQMTPPLAMQCVLANVAPSPLLDPHAQWTTAALKLIFDYSSKGRLLGKVYSVVSGIVAIELIVIINSQQTNINEELLKKGFAIPCEESYESKLNHDLRETATEFNMAQKRAYNKEQMEHAYYEQREIHPPSGKDCISDVCLKGPFSPLETSLHNIMYGGRNNEVAIEWNSVNSVLLDTEPQEVYERLIVSAEVGQNEARSKLTLRHTTIMPNIPGLPAIIALLFTPFAELRRDLSRSRYVSVLCGLGSESDGSPYFPEHDLLVSIDADLTVEDICLINHIRHLMDYMVFCEDGQDRPSADDELRAQVPSTIRKDLMELLRKRRKHREPQAVQHAWDWKSVPDTELLEISVPDMVERAVIYPLHVPQELHPISNEQLLQLKRENDELKTLIGRTPISSNQQMPCKLCDLPPMPMHAMRIHLYSNAHKDKEDDLRMFQS